MSYSIVNRETGERLGTANEDGVFSEITFDEVNEHTYRMLAAIRYLEPTEEWIITDE